MMSDADFLHRFDTFRLFLDSENEPLQPHDHQIVIKVSIDECASQYCVLTMIEPSTQARRFRKLDPIRDPVDIVTFFQRIGTLSDGMIPHTVMFEAINQPSVILKPGKRHGPAENIGNNDIVRAYFCKSIPKQCMFVFERPRPGHWPSEKTLKKAKKYGVFIVPQGPPKSTNICTYDYFEYRWRISTNLTERLFMFSLDSLHLKAFVLTKMIRKELFVPEYQDRLSTFHFKTAFFFAVENTRPDVWRVDNLINCVKYIFATLKRFLTRRDCPHFTIKNVNLFDGKIERHEFPKLVDKLAYVINSLRTKLEHMQIDNMGKTLNKRSTIKNDRSIYCSNTSALLMYVFRICHLEMPTYNNHLLVAPVNYRKAEYENEYTRFQTYYRAPLGKYRKYEFELQSTMSTLASILASVYLEEKADGREYNNDCINKARQMYTQSLKSDIIGNYMRYASFLFCNGEYDAACQYFDLIENLIQEDTKSNLVNQLLISPSESLALQIAKQSYEQTSKQRRSVFLIFSYEEAMCVPAFLRYELCRGRLCTLTSSGVGLYIDYDLICVQIEPYLYYLQYLTYRELHKEPKQSEALKKLSIIIEIIKSSRVISFKKNAFAAHGFCDTSLNMLGHCLELEQKWESAWKNYTTSLRLQPEANAAALHLTRLLWQVIQSLRT
ncbi:uncharacterized protein LOC127846956 isoform X2 [Dreissena polymorpha]|nr:uncharacterized protein LOC127846956 isoform X2 [Dreissena polymorpha]